MKKLLIVFLALILILGGLFLWKGGHHAVFLACAIEDWLDDDSSAQTFTMEINGISLSGETFRTEYNDRTLYALESGGYGMYMHQGILYLDTGKAYTLPDMKPDWNLVRKLLVGAIVHGRITKVNDIYHVTMQSEEMTIRADIEARKELEKLTLEAAFPWESTIIELKCALAEKPDSEHSLPREVLDAMVNAKIERPASITEPLDVLIPAMQSMLPLRSDVTLGVECGILTLSETVKLTIHDGAYLERNGETISLALPEGLSKIDPLTAGLALLRTGTFTRDGETSQFRIALPADATAELASVLVPQVGNLGITFTQSEAVVTIRSGKLTQASVTAQGEIPFLLTTIPLTFTANFDII